MSAAALQVSLVGRLFLPIGRSRINAMSLSHREASRLRIIAVIREYQRKHGGATPASRELARLMTMSQAGIWAAVRSMAADEIIQIDTSGYRWVIVLPDPIDLASGRVSLGRRRKGTAPQKRRHQK